MKESRNRLTVRVARVAVTCLLVLFAASAMAVDKAACHVIVETGEHLVKFVDTTNLSEAARVSLITESYGRQGAGVRVVEVVECIHYPGGHFTDRKMQKYMEEMPL